MASRNSHEAGLAESRDVAQKKLKLAVKQLTGCCDKDGVLADDDLVLPGGNQKAPTPLALTLVCQEQSAVMQSVFLEVGVEVGVFDDMSAEQKKATVQENRKNMNDLQKKTITHFLEGLAAMDAEEIARRSSSSSSS